MLPVNLNFASVSNLIRFKRHILQGTPSAITIASIVYQGDSSGSGANNRYSNYKIFTITLPNATSFTNNLWSVGMKLTLAGTVNYNGTYEILSMNATNRTINIAVYGQDKTFTETVGTITPVGLVPITLDDGTGTPILNNENHCIAYQYTHNGSVDEYFLLSMQDYPATSKAMNIQVVNNHATLALGAINVEWTLDMVNWLPFANALSVNSLAALTSVGFNINVNTAVNIRIRVSSASAATYYIIGG